MAHWQEDRAAFKAKFGLSFGAFEDLLNELSPDDHKRYDTILAASLKAAILWAIDQGVMKGLIPDPKDPAIRGAANLKPKGLADAAREALAMSEAREHDEE